ncbi:MAG: BrnT family toxin [Bdellovibrionota bacterium]
MLKIRYEWNEQKNAQNIKKHGISFEEAVLIFDGPIITNTDRRKDYGEKRQVSIGEIDKTIILVVIHTDRRGITRLISARAASKKERQKYYDYIKEKT